ncbi:MAG: hypothetical protein QOK05_2693 [Chloroflexota bacterium]|jgi:hypothetical protein|nr:hypothetical protein [Chloroflexota bacterium]
MAASWWTAMRNVGWGTRLRAWLLRTFRGRAARDSTWADEAPVTAGAPEAFDLGALRLQVNPTGLKAAGGNPPSIVYEVKISRSDDPRAWSSRYGFPPREASARRAADAALDELDEVWRDHDRWLARVTDGMSEDEVEAMEDSPAVRLDRRAAEWVGPELDPLREARDGAGTWLGDSA